MANQGNIKNKRIILENIGLLNSNLLMRNSNPIKTAAVIQGKRLPHTAIPTAQKKDRTEK
jgi:hypothetical protein